MNWNIITDSSCDLLPSTSPDGRIRLTSVPFTIRIGERDFVDDEHLDTLEMLSAMEQERSAFLDSTDGANSQKPVTSYYVFAYSHCQHIIFHHYVLTPPISFG